jgi:hypothetical protein
MMKGDCSQFTYFQPAGHEKEKAPLTLLTLAGQVAITAGLATALGDDDGLACGEALAVAEPGGADEAPGPGAPAWLPQEVATTTIKPSNMVANTRFIRGLTPPRGVLFQAIQQPAAPRRLNGDVRSTDAVEISCQL